MTLLYHNSYTFEGTTLYKSILGWVLALRRAVVALTLIEYSTTWLWDSGDDRQIAHFVLRVSRTVIERNYYSDPKMKLNWDPWHERARWHYIIVTNTRDVRCSVEKESQCFILSTALNNWSFSRKLSCLQLFWAVDKIKHCDSFSTEQRTSRVFVTII